LEMAESPNDPASWVSCFRTIGLVSRTGAYVVHQVRWTRGPVGYGGEKKTDNKKKMYRYGYDV